MKSGENFTILEELADQLGAAGGFVGPAVPLRAVDYVSSCACGWRGGVG
eukprot:COSAG01_NODE_2987_length_6750_cov_7.311382_4_plen_49_part_00